MKIKKKYWQSKSQRAHNGYSNTMINEKYHTVQTAPISNRQLEERVKFGTHKIKALFIYFNLCRSVMLDSLSCLFTSMSYSIITLAILDISHQYNIFKAFQIAIYVNLHEKIEPKSIKGSNRNVFRVEQNTDVGWTRVYSATYPWHSYIVMNGDLYKGKKSAISFKIIWQFSFINRKYYMYNIWSENHFKNDAIVLKWLKHKIIKWPSI
jgi:hypothetical protein